MLHILEPHSVPSIERLTGFAHSTQEARIAFKPVFEPVIFGLEPDQDASRPAVPSDDDFLVLSQAEIPRQVVFHDGKSDFTTRLRRALRATALLPPW